MGWAFRVAVEEMLSIRQTSGQSQLLPANPAQVKSRPDCTPLPAGIESVGEGSSLALSRSILDASSTCST